MKYVLLVVLYLIVLLMVLSFAGCQLIPMGATEPVSDTITTVVTKTNWLVTVAILGIALSVVAFINGSKMAIPAFVGSCVALGVTLAVIKYAAIIAGITLVLAGGVCVYAIFAKTRAIKELVTGGEKVKAWLDKSEDKKSFNEIHQNTQSKTTQALIEKAKNGGNNAKN
jgi:hypothetical protein